MRMRTMKGTHWALCVLVALATLAALLVVDAEPQEAETEQARTATHRPAKRRPSIKSTPKSELASEDADENRKQHASTSVAPKKGKHMKLNLARRKKTPPQGHKGGEQKCGAHVSRNGAGLWDGKFPFLGRVQMLREVSKLSRTRHMLQDFGMAHAARSRLECVNRMPYSPEDLLNLCQMVNVGPYIWLTTSDCFVTRVSPEQHCIDLVYGARFDRFAHRLASPVKAKIAIKNAGSLTLVKFSPLERPIGLIGSSGSLAAKSRRELVEIVQNLGRLIQSGSGEDEDAGLEHGRDRKEKNKKKKKKKEEEEEEEERESRSVKEVRRRRSIGDLELLENQLQLLEEGNKKDTRVKTKRRSGRYRTSEPRNRDVEVGKLNFEPICLAGGEAAVNEQAMVVYYGWVPGITEHKMPMHQIELTASIVETPNYLSASDVICAKVDSLHFLDDDEMPDDSEDDAADVKQMYLGHAAPSTTDRFENASPHGLLLRSSGGPCNGKSGLTCIGLPTSIPEGTPLVIKRNEKLYLLGLHSKRLGNLNERKEFCFLRPDSKMSLDVKFDE